MDLSKKVRIRREELGWSQDELARRMGYSSRSSINKIENGRPCSQKIIARLARALDVPIAYLMDWDEIEEPTVNNDGLSDSHIKLIEIAKTLSEEDAAMLLAALQAKQK